MKRMILLAAAVPLVAAQAPAPGKPEGMMTARQAAPARDGNIAIQEEYCAARKTATVEAWELFIARHPRHPLADDARLQRDKLTSR